MKLSLIILCFRSEESVIPFVEDALKIVKELTDDYELVLVGNYLEGSSDKTREIVVDLEERYDKVFSIAKPKEGMMGWDMREGLAFATGDILAVIDGDGQFPLMSLRDCFKTMAEGGYDLVKTYRKSRGDGIYRKIISRTYNLLFQKMFPGVASRDINSKPKLLTRSLYDQLGLTSDDWFVDAEIMLKVNRGGFKIKEIPIEFFAQKGRASFVKMEAIVEFIKNMIRYKRQGY